MIEPVGALSGCGVGEIDFGGRAAGIADDQRARAGAAGAAAELPVIGVRPVVGDVDIVVDQISPEIE